MHRNHRYLFLVMAGLLFVSASRAQDPRNVQEPVIPPICTTLTAELASGTVPGSISSETQLDSPSIQAAMNACPAGQAVELAMGGTNAVRVRAATCLGCSSCGL